jgi:hypothetical protein
MKLGPGDPDPLRQALEDGVALVARSACRELDGLPCWCDEWPWVRVVGPSGGHPSRRSYEHVHRPGCEPRRLFVAQARAALASAAPPEPEKVSEPMALRAADALAAAVDALVASGRLDARCPAADALLDYIDIRPLAPSPVSPPGTEKAEPCPECGVAPGVRHRGGCFFLTGDPTDLAAWKEVLAAALARLAAEAGR